MNIDPALKITSTPIVFRKNKKEHSASSALNSPKAGQTSKESDKHDIEMLASGNRMKSMPDLSSSVNMGNHGFQNSMQFDKYEFATNENDFRFATLQALINFKSLKNSLPSNSAHQQHQQQYHQQYQQQQQQQRPLTHTKSVISSTLKLDDNMSQISKIRPVSAKKDSGEIIQLVDDEKLVYPFVFSKNPIRRRIKSCSINRFSRMSSLENMSFSKGSAGAGGGGENYLTLDSPNDGEAAYLKNKFKNLKKPEFNTYLQRLSQLKSRGSNLEEYLLKIKGHHHSKENSAKKSHQYTDTLHITKQLADQASSSAINVGLSSLNLKSFNYAKKREPLDRRRIQSASKTVIMSPKIIVPTHAKFLDSREIDSYSKDDLKTASISLQHIQTIRKNILESNFKKKEELAGHYFLENLNLSYTNNHSNNINNTNNNNGDSSIGTADISKQDKAPENVIDTSTTNQQSTSQQQNVSKDRALSADRLSENTNKLANENHTKTQQSDKDVPTEHLKAVSVSTAPVLVIPIEYKLDKAHETSPKSAKALSENISVCSSSRGAKKHVSFKTQLIEWK